MRTLIRVAALASMAASAFAADVIVVDAFPLPEPGILSLIAVGAVALMAARRRK